jgi:hypothetical protein
MDLLETKGIDAMNIKLISNNYDSAAHSSENQVPGIGSQEWEEFKNDVDEKFEKVNEDFDLFEISINELLDFKVNEV